MRHLPCVTILLPRRRISLDRDFEKWKGEGTIDPHSQPKRQSWWWEQKIFHTSMSEIPFHAIQVARVVV